MAIWDVEYSLEYTKYQKKWAKHTDWVL